MLETLFSLHLFRSVCRSSYVFRRFLPLQTATAYRSVSTTGVRPDCMLTEIDQSDVDVVTLLVGHRNCDSQVAGSSPGRALLRSGLAQATYTCLPLLSSSMI